jgi:futalosine hydrolase
MAFKILYITSTSIEAEALKMIKGMIPSQGFYIFDNLEINLLISGVGSISTAWSVKEWLSVNGKPDLAINGGIAGSYKENIEIGSVVMPITDCFADAGIEDRDNFLTLPEAGLMNPDEFPFKQGVLHGDPKYCDEMLSHLKPVKAITVNTATGSDATRIKMVKKYNPDIETMEGATFFYICIREKMPFLALRAISNKVESRNRSNWKIQSALVALSEKLEEIILTL